MALCAVAELVCCADRDITYVCAGKVSCWRKNLNFCKGFRLQDVVWLEGFKIQGFVALQKETAYTGCVVTFAAISFACCVVTCTRLHEFDSPHFASMF